MDIWGIIGQTLAVRAQKRIIYVNSTRVVFFLYPIGSVLLITNHLRRGYKLYSEILIRDIKSERSDRPKERRDFYYGVE